MNWRRDVLGSRFRLVLCGVAYLAGAMRWHETPMQIVTVLGVCSVVCLAATLACLPWRQMKGRPGEWDDFRGDAKAPHLPTERSDIPSNHPVFRSFHAVLLVV